MGAGKAIVTLVIGDRYAREFQALALPGWRAYAERHSYDLIVLDEAIDRDCDLSRKSLHWQKLLVGGQPEVARYDWVVWLDADIVINPRTAPCVVSQVKGDGIGVADFTFDITPDEDVRERFLILDTFFRTRRTAFPVLKADMAAYYRMLGLEGRADRLVNSGVFVFRPRRHNDFLAGVYAKYDADCADGSLENTPFAFELQDEGLAEFIDERFNRVWSAYAAVHYPFLFVYDIVRRHIEIAKHCVNAFYQNSYFCHFAGVRGHPITKSLIAEIRPEAAHVLEAMDPELWKSLVVEAVAEPATRRAKTPRHRPAAEDR